MIPRILAFTPDVVGGACIAVILIIAVILSLQALIGAFRQ